MNNGELLSLPLEREISLETPFLSITYLSEGRTRFCFVMWYIRSIDRLLFSFWRFSLRMAISVPLVGNFLRLAIFLLCFSSSQSELFLTFSSFISDLLDSLFPRARFNFFLFRFFDLLSLWSSSARSPPWESNHLPVEKLGSFSFLVENLS